MNRKTLENNLKAIKKVNPNFSLTPENIKLEDWITIIESKNKNPNLQIKHGSKIEHAFDLNNPKKQARGLIRDEQCYKEDVNIVIGIGLGYIVKAILNKMEKNHKILIVEPIPHMLMLGLSNFNFTKEIENGTIIIATDTTAVGMIIGLLDNKLIVENWYVTLNKYTRLRAEEYQKITTYALEIINQTRCNTGTVQSAGNQIANNDISNLPYVIRHRGVSELKDLFKDKPAVLVSTGPSLQKNIHELQKIQNNVIIIAVAQALRPLLAYDIRPDFICSVDFGKVNMNHLKGIMESDVPLVILNRTYAPLLKAYKGPKFIVVSPQPGFENTAAGILMDRGSIDQGGSVAHMCLGLAYHLGCDPIVLTGQDLSYEGENSHIALHDTGGKIKVDENGMIAWDVNDQRSHLNSDKTKQFYSMGLSINVPGYYGGVVKTNAGLASFITSFEAMGKLYGNDRTLYNCTEGGAWINGFKNILLQDFVKNYLDNINIISPIDKTNLEPLLSFRPDIDEQLEKAIPLLEEDIKILEVIKDNSEEGLKSNNQISNMVEKQKKNEKGEPIWDKESQKELIKLFKENKKNSVKAHESAKKNNLIGLAIYRASRQLYSRELNVSKKAKNALKNVSDLKARLKSNKMILEAALEASKSLMESYKESLELLKKFQETKDENLLIDNIKDKIDFSDAEDYFKIGNFAHPLLDARKILYNRYYEIKGYKHNNSNLITEAKKIETEALEMREKAIKDAKEVDKSEFRNLLRYNECIKQSRKEGKENNNLDKAIELIKEAIRLFPKKQEARWGLATTYHHIRQYDKSIKVYNKLIKDFPKNLLYKFEKGQVEIVLGDTKNGFQTIQEVLEKTDKFDSFLKRMGNLYFKSKVYAEAFLAFEKYLEKFPADYESWEKIATCLYYLGRKKEANDAALKAQSIKTNKYNDLFKRG